MENLRPIHRAYIAGVFDGEGCVSFGNGHRCRIAIYQKDPEVLQWIQTKLGYGGLYPMGEAWQLVFTNRKDMLAFVLVVKKYSIVKRHKLRAAEKALED